MNYYVIHFLYFLMKALWHVSSLFNIKTYSLLGWKVLWVMLAARAYVLYLLLCRLNKKVFFLIKVFFYIDKIMEIVQTNSELLDILMQYHIVTCTTVQCFFKK